jgi:hypothetical protein
MTFEAMARIRDSVLDALFSGQPSSVEQATDALREVTRWAWLPALSGVAVSADHARGAHENAARAGVE